MEQHYTIIQVMDESGNWYNNAFVENQFDAFRIYHFYTNELGYKVKVLYKEKDITELAANMDIVDFDTSLK